MIFSLNINLKLFDINSDDDYLQLCKLFEDSSINEFIEDNMYAEYIYFIKEENEIIGFIYLMPFRNSNIYNLKYGIVKNKINLDYIYTILTLIRDKIKGINSTEIKNLIVVTSLNNKSEYNDIVCNFGNLIYSDEIYNYYEVNPNCENLNDDKEKILSFLKK